MNQPQHRVERERIAKIESAAKRGPYPLYRSKTAHFQGESFWA